MTPRRTWAKSWAGWEMAGVEDLTASATRFATFDDAVKLASDSEYGMALGILTSDAARELALVERIPTGMVHINDQTLNDGAHVPFGGVLVWCTGFSRFGGATANIEAFTESRWITARGDIARYPFRLPLLEL